MENLKTWDNWQKIDEKPFNFKGEIYITRESEPFTFIFCFTDSSFPRAVGGLHNDVLRPESVEKHDWRNLKEAIATIALKSQIMEEKNLLHELPFGGFKAGLAVNPGIIFTKENRIKAFKLFGYCLNYFNGKAYSGADVNTDTFDLMISKSVSPFIVGNPPNYGGGGDPSPYTAEGVYWVQKAFLKWKTGSDSMKDVKIAIKGAGGKVGFALLKILYEEGANLVVAEINKEKEAKIKSLFSGPRIEIKDSSLIHNEKCQILAPCDSGATITSENIEYLNAEAIIGATNAQTRAETQEKINEMENRLYEKNIFHPDPSGAFPNGGGVLEVADELLEGGFNQERLKKKIQEFYDRTLWLLKESREQNKPPYLILQEWINEKRNQIK